MDSNGVPGTGAGSQVVTYPTHLPVAGNTRGFFQGRVYAPSAASLDRNNVTMVFAGYHTPKPKNGLGDYRTIGRVSLHASEPVRIINPAPLDDQDQNDSDGNN